MVPAEFDRVVRLLLADELALLEHVLGRADGGGRDAEGDRAGVAAGLVQGVAGLLPPVQGRGGDRVPLAEGLPRAFGLVAAEGVQVPEQTGELRVGEVRVHGAEQGLLDLERALNEVGQEPHALHHVASRDLLGDVNHPDDVFQLLRPVLQVLGLLGYVAHFPVLGSPGPCQALAFLYVEQVVQLPEVVLDDLHDVVEPSHYLGFADFQLVQLVPGLVLDLGQPDSFVVDFDQGLLGCFVYVQHWVPVVLVNANLADSFPFLCAEIVQVQVVGPANGRLVRGSDQ